MKLPTPPLISLLGCCAFFFTVSRAHSFIPRLKLPTWNAVMTRASPDLQTMKQRVDHFSWFNWNTFDMRYASNAEFFNGTGPMIVFIGGESKIEDALPYIYIGGLCYEIARQLGAYMFLPEHRFYGESVPNNDYGLFNLRHLKVSQALADLADFIKDRKTNIPELKNSKVIVIGGSYPGSLAAWMRLKYPDLVDAAHSSSGIFNINVDNYQFNQVVQKSLNPYAGCVDTIREGVLNIKQLFESTQGTQQVKEDFRLTSDFPLEISIGKQAFFNAIMFTLDTVVQYDRQARNLNMQSMCQNLTKNSATQSAYMRLAAYMIDTGTLQSNGTDDQLDKNGNKAWTYQVCTELGSFVTTDGENQPYNDTVPLTFWQLLCFVTFGPLVNPIRTGLGVTNLRSQYGATNPGVTKVVFTVGSVDPWSGIGLTQDLNALAPVIIIHGASHCADLLPESRLTSTELTSARKRVTQLISTWIK